MGAHFSSQQLSGGSESRFPALSYAYTSGNTAFFGADATYTYNGPPGGPVGLITPYLVQPAAPTVVCSPFSIQQSSQSLNCPITGASLSGMVTLSFSQYTSTSTVGPDGVLTYFKSPGDNTLTDPGGDFTLSFVKPTLFVTVTPTPIATTTITSGVSEIPATSTQTVPKATSTVTVYQTTIISTSASLSTLKGASTVITVTGTCAKTSSTMLVCNADNCLRAMKGKSATATAFCSQYTKTLGMATPTYASQCSGQASRVSSACSCLVTPTANSRRGAIQAVYAPPDLTYGPGVSPVTSIVIVGPTSTVTVGPTPSSTSTDPDSTVSLGTSISTDNEPATVTTTVIRSTVDLRTASTVTVAPTKC